MNDGRLHSKEGNGRYACDVHHRVSFILNVDSSASIGFDRTDFGL